MAKNVYVTKAQQDAAKLIVKRTTARGKTVRSSIAKIAAAPAKNGVNNGKYGTGAKTSIKGTKAS